MVRLCAHAKPIIECGYSTAAECENAIGKGGMCFVDPDYALNGKRVAASAKNSAMRPRRPARAVTPYVFIESKNSALFLVLRSLSSRKSMASMVPIGLRMRRSTYIFLS